MLFLRNSLSLPLPGPTVAAASEPKARSQDVMMASLESPESTARLILPPIPRTQNPSTPRLPPRSGRSCSIPR